MKVNRTRSLSNAAMRKKGNTSDRAEEILAYEIVSSHLNGIVDHDKQKIVWFDDIHHAKLDVYFTIRSSQKYALRIMGKYHTRNDKHDRIQYYELLERGYIVIDCWWDEAVNLFLRNERILTPEELKSAYYEIKNLFKQFGLGLKQYNQTLIDQNS